MTDWDEPGRANDYLAEALRIRELQAEIGDLILENERFRAQRDEMLAALKQARPFVSHVALDTIDTILAKAEGKAT